MKKIYFTPIVLAMAAMLGACSSTPKTTSLLDQTRSDYVAAQQNPNIASYAQAEMKQASDALEQANAAARRDESTDKIDKLAYLAKQKIALTQEVAVQKLAEADVVASGKQRDQVRLDQRTMEADQAKQDVKVAQSDAAESKRLTQEAEMHAATLEQQLADLAAKKTDRGMVITLGDVLFGTDQSRLNSAGLLTAQKLADVLKQNPQRTVLVEGYADSTGSSSHNQELSERRATAVRNALQEMGTASARIAIRGYGEAYPIAANDTADNRRLNRRVEIVLSDDSGKISQR
ncbi:MAG: OmpA family protein [Pseudomonadota bacterium]